MRTVIITTTNDFWRKAKEAGNYSRSTIDSELSDVGFIHATAPNQTIAMLNRHFTDRDDVLLLLVDADKAVPEVRFEKPISGREELFPHIYGLLNTDAVYGTVEPKKDTLGNFVEPKELSELAQAPQNLNRNR